MNDLIKQIALECYSPYSNFDHEKFAKLIVKECIDKVEVWETDSRNHISYMLKQHFGVE